MAVLALPWHHSRLNMGTRDGLAGCDPGRSAENGHRALTFWYSDMRNQRQYSSIFHHDDDLASAKSGGGLAFVLLPIVTLHVVDHKLKEVGVLWTEWYCGDEVDDHGALGSSATRSSCSRTPERQAGS
jgi:hypothetical protein